MKKAQREQCVLLAAILCAAGVPGGNFLRGAENPNFFLNSMPAQSAKMAEFPVQPTEIPLEHTLSLNELVSMVVERHPSVVEAQKLTDAAYGDWVQAGLKANPEVEYVSDEMGGYKEWGTQVVGFSQEIISQEKRSARQAAAASDQQVARQNIDLYSQKATNDALLAGYALIIAQNKVQAAEEILQLSRKSMETVQSLFDTGESSASDLMVEQVNLMDVESTLAQANLELETAQDNIAILLGESLHTCYKISDRLEDFPLDIDEESLWKRILEESPTMRLAHAQYNAAVAKVNMETAESKVNVTSTAGVQYNTYEYQTEAAVGFSVPIRVNDRNQGNILKARYEVQAADENIRRTEMALRKEFQAKLFEFQSARRQVLLYRNNLINKVNETFEMVSQAYSRGETTYMERLIAERSVNEVRMDYLDQLHTMITSRILLEGFLLENADE